MKSKTRTIDPVQQIKRDGEQAARKVASNPIIEKLMRLGFAARKLIYFMIGLLVIQVAIGGRSGAVNGRFIVPHKEIVAVS
jgi:hypothetical protein